jgi:2-polyprenyl-6-methoxyphenol hydroxylase-like FAD-dependent oxidoreductase
VLVGEAAFVARPHVGAGVTNAALVAMGLSDASAASGDDLAAALATYDRERRRLGDWCIERGRYMGSRIRARPAGEAAPSTQELDRRAKQSVRDSIEVSLDIEKLTDPPFAANL